MPFCPNCGKEVSKDTKFCPECGKRPIKTQSEQPATSALYEEVSGGELGKRMSWFERHLHWTWGISYVVSLFLGVVGDFLVGKPAGAPGVVFYLVVCIMMISTSLWVLKEQERHWAWIFLAGWFSPLWLGNKSDKD